MPSSDGNQSQDVTDRFPDIFQTAPFAIYELGYSPPRFLLVNKAMCQLSGYSEQELLSMNPIDILDKDSAERFRHRIKQGLSGQVIDSAVEFKVKGKNGKEIWAILQVTPTYKNGKLDSALVVGFDITEHKKVEEDLKQSEAHYHSLFENIEDGFQLIEVIRNDKSKVCDFRYLEVNSAYEEQTGMKASQVLGKLAREVIPNFAPSWLEVFGEVEKTGEPTKFENFGGAKGRFYQTFAFKFAKNQVGVFFKDITENKKAQEAIKESETRFRAVQENSLDRFTVLRPFYNEQGQLVDFIFVYQNARAAKMTGRKPEELIGLRMTQVYSTFPKTRFFSMYKQAIETRQVIEFEDRYQADGVDDWFNVRITPISDSIAIATQIITERKKAEEALVTSERNYRRLFETSLDGIVSRDKDGRMIDCNEAYEKMVGYTRCELKTLFAPELLPENWREHRKLIVKEVLETGRSVVFEREYLRKDGSTFPASVRSWRLADETGKVLGVWSVVRDITQQKALQRELEQHNLRLEKLIEERTKQLRDSERLAAIGTTAGMVGHDIRNPLQAITGDVYLLKDYLSTMSEIPAKRDVAESLESIEQNVSYINKIVADLQDYARPVIPKYIDAILYNLVVRCFRSIVVPENVSLSIDIDQSLRFPTDPALFQRILTNLVINAIQAMPKGGNLIIGTTKKQTIIVLSVGDTGVGIPEHVKPKLFTPMMTTKAKGQGLGLAVVKRLVEALNGTITFESQEGKGTKFNVELPQNQ
jgi:PAS domain S-box-containing protein